MCGITGFFTKNDVTIEHLKVMNDQMIHRGPDAGNEKLFGISDFNIGMAHRRLSILDLDERSNQPMEDETKQVLISFNGEIYNYREIKTELSTKYKFRTTSDTEVVLYAYIEWGLKCFEKFNGMFAIALFDRREEKLILARDRHGIKPLYYYVDKADFVFGSELRPLMKYPFFRKEINTSSLQLMLALKYIPGERTIFNKTSKLTPGTAVVVSEGQIIDRYTFWDTCKEYDDPISKGDLEDYVQNAVDIRLNADVEVATFLSAGIDSPLVTMLAMKKKPEINSFTIGFEDEKYDESRFASKIAEELKVNNVTKIISYEDMLEVALTISKIYDEPFGDSSQIPTYLVTKMMKDSGYKVVLSGDGGDEFFIGYRRYDKAENRFYKQKKIRALATLFSPLSRIFSRFFPLYLLSLFKDTRMLLYGLNSGYTGWLANLVVKDKSSQKSLTTAFSFVSKLRGKNPIEINSLFDQKVYMIDDILTKVDRASMANSIEVRVPLMDHNVSRYSYSIPLANKLENGVKKSELKKILYSMANQELFERPKQGFGIPLDRLLNEKVIKERVFGYIEKDSSNGNGLFRTRRLKRIINFYYHSNSTKKEKYTNFVWNYYVFREWYSEYI